ncbi:MAG: hypothetical protein RJQ14_27265 [Marinoscillum sp.]
MKKNIRHLLLCAVTLTLSTTMSCEDDTESCTGCPDDAPYGTLDGSCYATLSACESNESGNCVVCQ